jgi:hypothetical protein
MPDIDGFGVFLIMGRGIKNLEKILQEGYKTLSVLIIFILGPILYIHKFQCVSELSSMSSQSPSLNEAKKLH